MAGLWIECCADSVVSELLLPTSKVHLFFLAILLDNNKPGHIDRPLVWAVFLLLEQSSLYCVGPPLHWPHLPNSDYLMVWDPVPPSFPTANSTSFFICFFLSNVVTFALFSILKCPSDVSSTCFPKIMIWLRYFPSVIFKAIQSPNPRWRPLIKPWVFRLTKIWAAFSFCIRKTSWSLYCTNLQCIL